MQSAELRVRVMSRASRSGVGELRGGALIVRVSAPPADGQANAELCRLIAKRLGIGVRSVEIARGAHSREKVVRVHGLDRDELWRRLAPDS